MAILLFQSARLLPKGVGHVDDTKTELISTRDLAANFLELQDQKKLPQQWSAASIAAGHPLKMPNPYRAVAEGDPIYTSFIDYFGDDVSGNRSKSWNKHNNSYITHRNLPRKLLHQEFHIHLVSTSQHATIPEQYHAVKKLIDSTHTQPIKVRDQDGLTTRFTLQPHAEPSDNPAQSEVAAHIGAKGNHPCRKCDAGGQEIVKASDKGFHVMFQPGNPRNRHDIKAELEEQVKLACRGVTSHVTQRQTDSGTKDAYTQYWIEDLIQRFHSTKTANPQLTTCEISEGLMNWVKDNTDKLYSSFLTTEGFDPAKDTPVEILHTILLGVVKYIWHYSHSNWNGERKQLYSYRLQATDPNALSINGILHFKAWKSIGALSALLWHTEIDNLEQYCNDVAIAAANVQDSFALIDPTKIIRKVKIHLLAHLVEDIRRFGPLTGVATDRHESFNAVFRLCSVLSNHLAPSRDIAVQMGDQEGLKHRLMGGEWQDPDSHDWVSGGIGVRNFVRENPFIQTMLGWSNHVAPKIGSVTKKSAGKAINRHDFPDSDNEVKWIRCKSIIAKSEDICIEGSWVFCQSPIRYFFKLDIKKFFQEEIIIGRIKDILTDNQQNIIVLEEFHVSDDHDDFFTLPYLFRRQGEVSFVVVPGKNLLFAQNVQHDCVRKRKQERVESDQVDLFIEHKSDDRFLINLNAFHNTHLVWRVLPRSLTQPISLFNDRRKEHDEIAARLRQTLFSRKEQTQKKRDETAQKKRKAAEEVSKPGSSNLQSKVQPKPTKRARQNND
ncbi:hypothetical protein K435DRAFT_795704 [Dendrothele bispora CBS 962.96]|uniref:Uncharacterized protein n=1 Tax=Dendrothele bispora (strain CBS 962.96) TaxID=1314807 RepID=A0A4S8M962_DENBC|nr:hypothetical protein K435DRAFT_795704 [Dendrothele bispora CBS 962.96]